MIKTSIAVSDLLRKSILLKELFSGSPDIKEFSSLPKLIECDKKPMSVKLVDFFLYHFAMLVGKGPPPDLLKSYHLGILYLSPNSVPPLFIGQLVMRFASLPQVEREKWPLLCELESLYNAGFAWIYADDSTLYWCPNPNFSLDQVGRLHGESEPAILWPDGNAIYCWHGITVPKRLIMDRNSITSEELMSVTNVELRRCYMEALGIEKFVGIIGLQIVDDDSANGGRAILYSTSKADPITRQKIYFVKVSCASTGRNYFLCVPHEIKTAWEAVAWTFSKEGNTYLPDMHS